MKSEETVPEEEECFHRKPSINNELNQPLAPLGSDVLFNPVTYSVTYLGTKNHVTRERTER